MSSTVPTQIATDEGRGLRRLLGSLHPDVFLRDYIGEQMLHMHGTRERWADLFSWRDLDAILNSGFVSVPRVRLVREGAHIDPAAYTVTSGDRQIPESERCHRFMADGATLIVQNVEHSNPRIDALVRSLERDFHAYVRVDVVATCAPVPGLRMHWDNAECFNLQIDGEKDWRVVRPERPYPLTATTRFPQRQDVTTSVAPETAAIWSGTVVPGDLIYLPRGWWHAVAPRVTPSLHLSVSVEIPTLSDFVRWFAHRATQHEDVRRILPVWLPASDRQQRLAALTTALSTWLTPELLDEYIAEMRSPERGHPDFALTALATPGGPALTPATRLRLRATTPLCWTVKDGWLTFEWRGESYRFNAMVLPALQTLESRDSVTLEELCGSANRVLVQALVLSLLTSGLLSIRDDGVGSRQLTVEFMARRTNL